MEASEVPGATPLDVCQELRRIASTILERHAIVELGVFKGRSLCHLGLGAREGHGAHVWGVDPWDLPGQRKTYMESIGGLPHREGFNKSATRRAAQRHIDQLGLSDAVTLVRGFSHEVGSAWSGPRVAFMFVDGDHHEAAILREFEAWRPHFVEGAIIAFDDHEAPFHEVISAVRRLHQDGKITQPVVKLRRLALATVP